MTLIKSISGMRGTLGGQAGDNLTAIDIVEFCCAYATLIQSKNLAKRVVVGRDGRISGPAVQELAMQSLVMMGFTVFDLGLSTTPTVEMAVTQQGASGGIIITASHNPMEWNALKFLNEKGEFISHEDGNKLLDIAGKRSYIFANTEELGQIIPIDNAIIDHIKAILDLPLVQASKVNDRKFKVVVDCINSTGAIAIPALLNTLGVEYVLINKDISGQFAHNPEPLEHNLIDLSEAVIAENADLGIAVDPDVDRLAFVDEYGRYCGEEYTLVMVAQWVLDNTPGNTVSNLSSTIVLRQITEKAGQQYEAAAVGEVNVVNKMKEINAVIGGEGNGGIIYPALHNGRDALVGIALLLTALEAKKMSMSQYRALFPDYTMTKDKIQLTPAIDVDYLLSKLEKSFEGYEIDTQDGVKIYFDQGWTHLRKSNTEPIIRLYAEGNSEIIARQLSTKVHETVEKLIN